MVADVCFARFPTYENAVKMSSAIVADHSLGSIAKSVAINKKFVFCDGRRSSQMSLSAIISNDYPYPGVFIAQQLKSSEKKLV